jgi:hypothetical protein
MSISFLLIIGIILTALIAFANTLSAGAGRKASQILRKMDERYEEFAQNYLTTLILEDQDIEVRQVEFTKQIIKVLKPDIDGLLAHINATEYSDVKVKYKSKYFSGVARFAESLFYKRHKFNSIPVSEEDTKKLFETCTDAVEADLTSKLLLLKAGRI